MEVVLGWWGGGVGYFCFLLMALLCRPSYPGLTFDLSLHHIGSTLIAILKVQAGQRRAATGWMKMG